VLPTGLAGQDPAARTVPPRLQGVGQPGAVPAPAAGSSLGLGTEMGLRSWAGLKQGVSSVRCFSKCKCLSTLINGNGRVLLASKLEM